MTSITIGPGIVTSLTILFVILKAFDKISWSWWMVFSPIWITVLIFISIILFLLILMIVSALLD